MGGGGGEAGSPVWNLGLASINSTLGRSCLMGANSVAGASLPVCVHAPTEEDVLLTC